MVKKYISDGTWFVKGAECELIDDYRPQMDCGLFFGLRICEIPESEARSLGEEYMDEEICSFDEFGIIEVNE